MVRGKAEPLSVEEAKARLRAAADRISLSTWVQRHPKQAVGAALLGGLVFGRLGSGSDRVLLQALKLVPPLLYGMEARKSTES